MFVCEDYTPVERGRWSPAAPVVFPKRTVRQRWPRSRESALLSQLAGSLVSLQACKGSSLQQSGSWRCHTSASNVPTQAQAQARRSTSTGVLQSMFEMRITRHKSQNTWNAEFNYIRRACVKDYGSQLCSPRELFYLRT
jgi:hypothetical protein